MEITFLGTGTSHGVPSIDCMINDFRNCPKGVCKASVHDTRHRRTRSSILIKVEKGNLLIDVSADFREQALRENLKNIDAVLLTHNHADHIGGIPDIRSYTTNKVLPFYGSPETIESIRSTYRYIFDPNTFVGGGIPQISTTGIEEKFDILGVTIQPVRVKHGSLLGAYGYKIGPLTYIPDMKSISDSELAKIEGTDTLILNCLRTLPVHSSHLILSESIELAKKIKPRHCYFIHMCHDIHYELDSKGFEPWMEFSFDGLRIDI